MAGAAILFPESGEGEEEGWPLSKSFLFLLLSDDGRLGIICWEFLEFCQALLGLSAHSGDPCGGRAPHYVQHRNILHHRTCSITYPVL